MQTIEHSFERLYAEQYRGIHALCRRLIPDPADAEDAVQETFLAVARGLPRFRGDSSVKTWIHRIAIRVAVRVRARARSHEHTPHTTEPDEVEGAPRMHPVDRVTVERAFDTLGYEHRLILSLFAVSGLTHPEIADVLGIPEGTAWSRLHIARQKLTAALASNPAPEPAPLVRAPAIVTRAQRP